VFVFEADFFGVGDDEKYIHVPLLDMQASAGYGSEGKDYPCPTNTKIQRIILAYNREY